MAPNTFKLQSLDAFATIDKTLFLRKNTPLLSTEERQTAESEDVFSFKHLEKQLLADAKRREDEQAKLTPESEVQTENEYWGWCNDETALERRIRENNRLLQSILKEEEARLFFSAEETTKRLIQEAHSKTEPQEQIESANLDPDSDYWTWRSDQDDINHYFSVEKLQEDLLAESKRRAAQSDKNFVNSRSNRADYWEWDSCETALEKREKAKKELLANMLLEEQIRKEFLVETIEQRLIEESEEKKSSKIISAGGNSDDYWEW